MPVYLKYYFWIVAVSLLFFVLERIKPWRPKQEVLRDDLAQDFFWLVFNQQYVAWVAAIGIVELISWIDSGLANFGLPAIGEFKLLSDWPLAGQIAFAFILKDFIEWNVHRLLHTVPWMWEFHKLHHSIEKLDWLGAFRTHWGEIFIHRLAGFIPLVALGIDGRAILIIAVSGIVIQELSHSNLRLDWGPLRYVFNSPRYHAWHHDVKMHGKGGQNFGINLTIWDWMFGTSYWPEDAEQPEKYGFGGMKKYPRNLIGRLLHPFIRIGK